MKKILLAILCAVLVLTFAACNGSKDKEIEGTLEDITAEIYAGVEVDVPHTMNTEVTAENAAYYLGTDTVEYTEALASDAAISAIPHSMVLIRVAEGSDVEAAKTLIKDNVDPRKWICVGVEDDQVIVDNIGNLIFLVMNENAEVYHQSFLKLAE